MEKQPVTSFAQQIDLMHAKSAQLANRGRAFMYVSIGAAALAFALRLLAG